jgi:hypothetical protein
VRHPLRELALARRVGSGPWAAIALVGGDVLRAIAVRLGDPPVLHPLLRADLEIRADRAAHQRAARERRRRALEQRAEARFELALAQDEQDAIFSIADERDAEILRLDEFARDQEQRAD